MKKTWYGLLLVSLFASPVYADDVYIDVGAAVTQFPGNAGTPFDVDTFTSIFDHLQLFADTTTVQYDTDASGFANIGDRFIDSGTAVVTDLLPPLGDDEGLGFLSELTVSWTGLTGVLTSDLTPIPPFGDLIQTFAYDPNSTIFSFYYHGDATATNADFGAAVGVADNVGFTDGEHVLDLLIKGGTGTNTFDAFGDFLSGSSILDGEVVFALNDFWWFDNGDGIPGTAGDEDFNDLLGLPVPITITSRIDQNTDQVITDFSNAGIPGPVGFGDELFRIHSTHDGSMNFAQQVPIPQTMLLLALGLALFALINRRFTGSSLQRFSW